MQSPFRSRRDVLFADRAVALQVPYPRPDAPILPYTLSTAQEAGWIWDIGLHKRRGIGYVYSSRHTDATRAEEVIRDYVGEQAAGLDALHLKFETGYRPEHWRRNCVAVGLAGGFVEPLESTGIALIELAAYLVTAPVARRRRRHGTHRAAFQRDDGRALRAHHRLHQDALLPDAAPRLAFWIDNADPASIPQTLQDRLAMWRYRPPHRLDFVTDLEMFLPASWQYVLYGMEFQTDLGPMRSAYPQMDAAHREFAMIRQMAGHALDDLPDHRALVEQLCREHEKGAGNVAVGSI